ncbi:hypothetical protein HZA43_02360 [Candidatus Peregrinibacteria bacterium]|nr:hypothetical protein [Candidatus Peregrinibacteria bacterium]
MSDEKKPPALKIPTETQQKFPDLVESIQKSQSMDQEEHQYWIDALPVMTEDQIKNLRDILESEQKQLEKAKKDHEKATGEIAEKYKVNFDSFQYKERKRLIKEAEAKEKNREGSSLEQLMKDMKQL